MAALEAIKNTVAVEAHIVPKRPVAETLILLVSSFELPVIGTH